MKKFFLIVSLSCSLITAAFAEDNSLDLLNAEIKNILAPYQNSATSASFQFDAMELDNEHALKLGLNTRYRKIGSKNILEIKVDNLNYDYKDGKSPTTVFKGSIGFDLTKLLTPEESNQMVPLAMDLLEEIVSSFVGEYGEAITFKGGVTSTSKDEGGNYTGLTALISSTIDLTKLPANVPQEEIMVTDTVFSVTLNLKTGITMEALIVSNPGYIGFQEGQTGVKELLEHLIARDGEVTKMIESLFIGLDFMASGLVELGNLSARDFILNLDTKLKAPLFIGK